MADERNFNYWRHLKEEPCKENGKYFLACNDSQYFFGYIWDDKLILYSDEGWDYEFDADENYEINGSKLWWRELPKRTFQNENL